MTPDEIRAEYLAQYPYAGVLTTCTGAFGAYITPGGKEWVLEMREVITALKSDPPASVWVLWREDIHLCARRELHRGVGIELPTYAALLVAADKADEAQ